MTASPLIWKRRIPDLSFLPMKRRDSSRGRITDVQNAAKLSHCIRCMSIILSLGTMSEMNWSITGKVCVLFAIHAKATMWLWRYQI